MIGASVSATRVLIHRPHQPRFSTLHQSKRNDGLESVNDGPARLGAGNGGDYGTSRKVRKLAGRGHGAASADCEEEGGRERASWVNAERAGGDAVEGGLGARKGSDESSEGRR